MGVGGRGVEVTVWLNSMFDSRHNPKIKLASRPLPLKHILISTILLWLEIVLKMLLVKFYFNILIFY